MKRGAPIELKFIKGLLLHSTSVKSGAPNDPRKTIQMLDLNKICKKNTLVWRNYGKKYLHFIKTIKM